MLFRKEFVEKILLGKKTCTTRFRKHAMVKVGNIYKAKTNRFSKEHFALIKVVSIRSADFTPHNELGRHRWLHDLELTIGYENREWHAEKEGFEDWYEFRDVYTDINAAHRDDAERRHWIIDFGVVNADGEFIATKFRIGDWVSWERYGEQKTAEVLGIDYSEFNGHDRYGGWCYKLNSFVNNVENFWDWEMEEKLRVANNPNID